MKLCSLFFALALAAKAKQATKSMKMDDSQGADDSQVADQSAGYGQQQQSYGGEQSYATQSYAEPATVAAVAPTCCVSMCPDHAPYFNPVTCGCVPGYVEQDMPAYQNTNFYAGQQSYGAQQQSGYRHLQAYDFGAPVATAPDFTSGPDGTFDTRNLRINRTGTIVLWVAFGILFLLACYYLRMFHWYYHIAEADDNTSAFVLTHNGGAESVHHSILHFLSNPSLIAGCVCLIASLAYLTMATDNGWYTRCHDGRQFFFARYIDWVVTTPLMLHALAHFANSPDEIWNFLFFSDVLMIVSGLVASTIDGPEKWIYFGFSILAFIPVLYYICKLREQLLNNRWYHSKTGLLMIEWNDETAFLPYIWFFHNYQVIADLTVLAWFCYPLVWIFAEGTNMLSVTGEAITYTILDLISKGVFGWFIVHSSWENPHARFSNRYVVKGQGPNP